VCQFRAILSSLLLLSVACLGCGKKDSARPSSQPSTASEHAQPDSVTPQPPAAPPQQAAPQASMVSELTGEVTKGHRFEKSVAGGLIFGLEPDAGDDSGWEIRLAPGADGASASMDCIGAISVPLHGDTTLSIQPPGVDKDRDESQWKKREFDFVPNSSDCKKAWDFANDAHYGSKLTDKQREEADANLGKIPTSHGAFEITDFRLSKPTSKDAPAEIEWLKFAVHLEFPLTATRQSSAPVTSQPPLHKTGEGLSVDEEFAQHAIRNADFDEAMTAVLAKRLGGRDAMEAACKESLRNDPVEIEARVFGDVDGDSSEEAAVTAFSCQAGQAGPDLFAVFKQLNTGEIIELPLEKPEDAAKFKGKARPQNLRGPWRIEIDNGRLIVRYLFWGPDAPKCGDADCASNFVYHWDGHKLALTDITQSPVN
jgi:hypothetical protein